MAHRHTGPLAVYVHYPYCASLCTYCAFNKARAPAQLNVPRFVGAYRAALAHAKQAAGAAARPLHSLYFGGGTPSLAPVELIAAVVEDVVGSRGTDIEVTLEANPAERHRLSDLRAAGITRLSIGVQSLHDDALQRLGRRHTAQDAREAVRIAEALFPGRTSLDLMWGRPGQTAQAWRHELREAIAMADGHLSLYQLVVERGTPLERQYRADPSRFPTSDELEAMWDVTLEETAVAGYEQYEASSFALPGHHSRHNTAYWRGFDYLGVGPGAHARFFTRDTEGHFRRERRIQILQTERWVEAVMDLGQDGNKLVLPLNQREMAEEMVMLGMQMRDGIDAARFRSYTGLDLMEFVDRDAAITLAQDGFIEIDDRGIRPSVLRGMRVIDSLVPRLLHHRNSTGIKTKNKIKIK